MHFYYIIILYFINHINLLYNKNAYSLICKRFLLCSVIQYSVYTCNTRLSELTSAL